MATTSPPDDVSTVPWPEGGGASVAVVAAGAGADVAGVAGVVGGVGDDAVREGLAIAVTVGESDGDASVASFASARFTASWVSS